MNRLNEILRQINVPEDRILQIGVFLETQESDNQKAPWYMVGLVGVSAWIAAILFVGFIVTALDYSTDSFLVVGLIPFAAAVFLNRLTSGSTFSNQLSLALGMTGQIIWAIELFENSDPIWIWLYPLFCAGIFFVHTGRFHRFFTVANGLIIFEFLLRDQLSYRSSSESTFTFTEIFLVALLMASVVGVSWIWTSLSPLKMKHRFELFRPLGFGLIAAVTFSLVMHASNDYLWLDRSLAGDVGGVIILLVLSALIFFVSQKNGVNPAIGTAATVALLVVPAWQAPGVVWGILLLVLSWQRKDRLLLGISLVVFAGFMSWFYYDLEISLLNKSYILFFSGLAMAAVYGLLSFFGSQTQEVQA